MAPWHPAQVSHAKPGTSLRSHRMRGADLVSKQHMRCRDPCPPPSSCAILGSRSNCHCRSSSQLSMLSLLRLSSCKGVAFRLVRDLNRHPSTRRIRHHFVFALINDFCISVTIPLYLEVSTTPQGPLKAASVRTAPSCHTVAATQASSSVHRSSITWNCCSRLRGCSGGISCSSKGDSTGRDLVWIPSGATK